MMEEDLIVEEIVIVTDPCMMGMIDFVPIAYSNVDKIFTMVPEQVEEINKLIWR